MRLRGVVAVQSGADDAAVAVREAPTSFPDEIMVESLEIDAGAGINVEDEPWGRAQLLSLSPRLREDPRAAELVSSIEDRFVRLQLPGAWAWYLLQLDPAEAPPWPWVFTCNICGNENRWTERAPGREGRSCAHCGSNARYRATMRALLTSLLGMDEALPDLAAHPDLRGLGIGDWPGYADRLAEVFDYTNTHLDREPRLDLTEEPVPELASAYDFVIAGDVLEHVAPPVETSMANLRRLLRPEGIAILTVPVSTWKEHIEHFPQLHRWRIEVGRDGDQVLVNERADGTTERFGSLCFHGPGRSLEMRVFTTSSFTSALNAAGFLDAHIVGAGSARHGILLHDWPGPVVARSFAS
jgi:hypothetical protein